MSSKQRPTPSRLLDRERTDDDDGDWQASRGAARIPEVGDPGARGRGVVGNLQYVGSHRGARAVEGHAADSSRRRADHAR